MITNEENRFLKSIARDWADLSGDAGRDRQNPTMSRIEATVTAINSDGSLTVNTSSEDAPSLKTFKRTTACDDAKVGDRVIVDTLNHISYITGVLSTGNPHYVKQLWSGAYYMQEGQVANLSELLSKQRSGIVLHWQGYASGAAQDQDHAYTFVPKGTSGTDVGGTSAMMSTASGTVLGIKYVYVRDDRIIGNANNSRGSTQLSSGITVTPNHWVLSEVLGV